MKKLMIFFSKHLYKVFILGFLLAMIGAYFNANKFAVWSFFIGGGAYLLGIMISFPYNRYMVEQFRAIKKGKHYPTSRHWPIRIFKSGFLKVSRTIYFYSSSIYRFNTVDDSDKNKLFGVSMRLLPMIKRKSWAYGKKVNPSFTFLGFLYFKAHHWNSVRIGWNCYKRDNSIRIYQYSYVNGSRLTVEICEVPIKTYVYFEMTVHELSKNFGQVLIRVRHDLNENEIRRTSTKISGKIYRLLDLYFGGNMKAPHNISINEATV